MKNVQIHRLYRICRNKHPGRLIFRSNKKTFQNPSVLCSPPLEKSPIKSHRFCVLPPLFLMRSSVYCVLRWNFELIEFSGIQMRIFGKSKRRISYRTTWRSNPTRRSPKMWFFSSGTVWVWPRPRRPASTTASATARPARRIISFSSG